MIFDIHNPRAGFVLAAYTLTFIPLLVLAWASWRASRRAKRDLAALRLRQSKAL